MALASRLIASSTLGNLLRGSTRIMVNSRPLSSSVVSLDRRQRCIMKATTTPVTIRCFSQWGPDPKPVDRKMVETRAMKVIGSYEKIDASKNLFMVQTRKFGHKPPLTHDFIIEKVFLVLQLYDKCDPAKLTMTTHFQNDMGLDSLDHVEVIMAIEDEFGFEIPDKDAEKLWTPQDLIKYIADKEELWKEPDMLVEKD